MPPLGTTAQAIAGSATTKATAIGAEVICAWPVSGQYGPGSRVLYYVLTAACVFAGKVEWLRNASLAAALLFPVVAAIHGIVLAIVHVPDSVDMDVYGAFQFCAIGALVAPVTVRLSGTYSDDPGRNAIFVWAMLVLAGLLSLTVEFYRIHSFSCTHDDLNNTISADPGDFPYGKTSCGMICDENLGPFSPLRGGSARNIYIIPAPEILTFNAATLLSAACCIPAILLCVSTWIKILEINYKKLFGSEESLEHMKGSVAIKFIRKHAMTVIFGGAVFAILVIGERNLWSTQVDYMTEPVSNVGQWAPIAGTGLAVLGSVYVLLAEAMTRERARRDRGAPDDASGIFHHIAKALVSFVDHISNPAKDRFAISDFRREADHFPEIPAEPFRNRALSQTRSTYDGSGRNSTSSLRSGRTRARSATVGSVAGSGDEIERTETGREVNNDCNPRPRPRRDTLEVPSPIHRTSTQGTLPSPPPSPAEQRSSDPTQRSPQNPAIVISPEIP